MELNTLRIRLQEITRLPVSDHDKLVQGLKKDYPHRINLVESFANVNKNDQYVCFMHALGLEKSQVIKTLMRTDRRVIFGTNFIHWLISNRIIKETEKGNIVLYFFAGQAKHAGLIKDDLVLSKWGIGNLWLHPRLEVPIDYGEVIKIFNSKVQNEVIEEEFNNWVKYNYQIRPGSNDPCPCGSGKKFKKCHRA